MITRGVGGSAGETPGAPVGGAGENSGPSQSRSSDWLITATVGSGALSDSTRSATVAWSNRTGP